MSASIEAAAVAVIILIVSFFVPSSPVPASRTSAAWDHGGADVLAGLVDDLTAAERDTADPANASPTAMQADLQTLTERIAAARRLDPPVAPASMLTWKRSLSQLAAGRRTLASATATLSPAAVALAHSQLARARDGIVIVERSFAASNPTG